MKYYVFLRDIDPDTGTLSQMIKMCECDHEKQAQQIRLALATQDETDPNREYVIENYGKKENVLLCADADQLELAWKCQLWMNDRGVRLVICFSPAELDALKETFVGYGIPHMVTLVGEGTEWKNVSFDLKLGIFDEEEFDTILSVLD